MANNDKTKNTHTYNLNAAHHGLGRDKKASVWEDFLALKNRMVASVQKN